MERRQGQAHVLWEFVFCVPSTTWPSGPDSGRMFLKLIDIYSHKNVNVLALGFGTRSGLYGGIERGWYTSKDTGTAVVHYRSARASGLTSGCCWPPDPTTTITTAAPGRRTVRRAGDCRQYGRSYYLKVAIRSGRYGMLVSSNSTGRNTGSFNPPTFDTDSGLPRSEVVPKPHRQPW